MKILVLNTSENTGGAAIAASRLSDALNRHGIETRLLVRDKQTQRKTTSQVPSKGLRGLLLKWAFVWERARVWMANRFNQHGLWAVDLGIGAAKVVGTKEFRQAELIHLHWVNQGFLSLSELRAILRSGKPVVWTMHDMWPCTAICHHARECTNFHTHCHHCPQLQRPRAHDLSWKVFEKKMRIYTQGHITFVGCSQWIASEAQKSRLLGSQQVCSIPNTYNHLAFHPGSNLDGRLHFTLPRKMKLLLFACQKVTNERKGLDFLFTALRSELMQRWQGNLALVVVGEMADEVAEQISFPVHTLDYISEEEEMGDLYRAVDLFVTPSLEENLPNTIMEAMACGTPCVGFEIGGVPEMIDHLTNGYVARYRDAEDLAKGIDFVLGNEHYDKLSQAAAEKATTTWNEDHVVEQYIKLYKTLLHKRS